MPGLGRSKVEFDMKTLMMVDSLDMANTDRKVILENYLKVKEDRILITHRTDTIAVTAKVLANGIREKTIVFS